MKRNEEKQMGYFGCFTTSTASLRRLLDLWDRDKCSLQLLEFVSNLQA